MKLGRKMTAGRGEVGIRTLMLIKHSAETTAIVALPIVSLGGWSTTRHIAVFEFMLRGRTSSKMGPAPFDTRTCEFSPAEIIFRSSPRYV